VQFATPVFDGATEREIKKALGRRGIPQLGKDQVVRRPEAPKFEQPVTVGYIYMMKLSHLCGRQITRAASGRTR